MHPRLVPIESLAQLESLLTGPDQRPLLLFKHSRSCGTSAQAFDELVEHLDTQATTARYAVVTVQSHRDVSNAVSSTLGIRHETPQVLLIDDRRVVGSATHFRVTADAVTAAINRVQPHEAVIVG